MKFNKRTIQQLLGVLYMSSHIAKTEHNNIETLKACLIEWLFKFYKSTLQLVATFSFLL